MTESVVVGLLSISGTVIGGILTFLGTVYLNSAERKRGLLKERQDLYLRMIERLNSFIKTLEVGLTISEDFKGSLSKNQVIDILNKYINSELQRDNSKELLILPNVVIDLEGICFEKVVGFIEYVRDSEDEEFTLDALWSSILDTRRNLISEIREEKGIKDKLGPSKYRS